MGFLKKSRHGQDRHALPSLVGYSQVNVKQIGMAGNDLGRTQYEFINYSEPFIPQITKQPIFVTNASGYWWHQYEVIKITNTNSNYGKLRRIGNYDKDNALISSLQHEYETEEGRMGRIEEAFFRSMYITDARNGEASRFNSVFYKSHINSTLKRTISMRDGVETSVEYAEKDPLTGQATLVKQHDHTNGYTEVEKIPAYTLFPDMESRYDHNNNYNILTTSADEIGRRNNNSSLAITSGSHREWDDDYVVHKYNGGSFQNVNTNNPVVPKELSIFNGSSFNGSSTTINWKPVGGNTLFDTKQRVLEQRGEDNQYSASRFGYNDRYLIANATNANFGSFTACGFEEKNDFGTSTTPDEYYDGELKTGNETMVGSLTAKKVHTGNYMIEIPAASIGPTFTTKENNQTVGGELVEKGLQTGRTYRASVWMHASNPSSSRIVAVLDGSDASGPISTTFSADLTANTNNTWANHWVLVRLDFEIPEDYVSSGGVNNNLRIYLENPDVSSPAYFDDFRFQPLDAAVSSIVMDKKRGLPLFELDNENFYTRYEYDAAGRLIGTFVEAGVGGFESKLNETKYNYARGTN